MVLQPIWLIVTVLTVSSSCSGMPHIVVPSDPLTAEEHVTLGAIYDQEGLHDEAQREFQAALNQKPDFVPALIGLGNVSFHEGNQDRAEQYYARALKIVPGHPGTSNNLAALYVEQGRRLEDAERLSLQALANGGSLKPYILHTLAALYLKQERYDEARTMLDEADSLVPHTQVAFREQIARSRQKLP